MKGQKSFSLTIMIIIMALLAIFVGYLLGNWLLQMLTGDAGEVPETAEPERPPLEQEEIIEPDSEIDDSEQQAEGVLEFDDSPSQEPSQPEYSVQVGAFQQHENALVLSEQLEEEGFEPMIISEDPYRVQLQGGEDREEAEEVLEKLTNAGFEAFITH